MILEVVQIFKDRDILKKNIFPDSQTLQKNLTGTYETMYYRELIPRMSEVEIEGGHATLFIS